MKINTNQHYGSSVECDMCPIDAVCTVVEILSLKYIRVASLNLRLRDVSGHVIFCRCFIGTDTNLKSIALTILELLAPNAQKFMGSRDPGQAPFSNSFKGSCRDCSWEHACQVLSL